MTSKKRIIFIGILIAVLSAVLTISLLLHSNAKRKLSNPSATFEKTYPGPPIKFEKTEYRNVLQFYREDSHYWAFTPVYIDSSYYRTGGYYPQFKGLKDKAIEENLNASIRESYAQFIDAQVQAENANSPFGGPQYQYMPTQLGNLLVLENKIKYGAPSGTRMYQQSFYFDLTTGKALLLKDLIKEDQLEAFFNNVVAKIPPNQSIYHFNNDLDATLRDANYMVTPQGMIYGFLQTPDNYFAYFVTWEDLEYFLDTDGRFYKALFETPEEL